MFHRRILTGFIAAVLLAAGSPAAGAEPEALAKEALRPGPADREGTVEAFLGRTIGEFRSKMNEALASGEIARTDEAAVKAEIRKLVPGFLEKTAAFRATLETPEERYRLDRETLNLGVMGGDPATLSAIIGRWKGWARESMIAGAAEAMQRGGLAFTPEMDALLAELSRSSDEVLVAAGKRFLDPFRRDPVGKPFPPFPAGKLTTDGKPLTLERFKGKVLLVDFWATWCGPCRAEVPDVVKAYEAYKGKGFEIVGISFDKERAAFDEYLAKEKMTWPQYFDGLGWKNEVGPAYGIDSIPAMYLLDREGKVVSADLRGGKLEQELRKLLP